MQVTLSERKFNDVVRQMEGLDAATTAEEITDRMQHYANRLFEHLRNNYGVSCQGMLQHTGGLGTFQFSLSPARDLEDRSTRLAGISMMNPNSVTVEESDLPALCPNAITRVSLEDNWLQIAGPLMKCLPGEIPDLLERAAQQSLRSPDIFAQDPSTVEQGFEYWLERTGLKDPLAAHRQREAAEQKELARIEAERDAAYMRFRNGE